MSAPVVNRNGIAEIRAALLLKAVVDSSDDAIISKDLNGVIMSWNKSAQRLFGYTAEEAIGKTVAELLIPADRQEEEPNILARLARGERVDHFETVRRRKDGTLLDISLTISPIKDASGTIIGASKVARDITDAKRIRNALVESEARFRQLADAMPQMVWTARPDGSVDYYNQRWYDFTGFDPNESGAPDWRKIIHPDEAENAVEAFSAAIHSGQPYNIECRLWDAREKRWRWFVVRALPACNAQDVVEKWFGTCTDIDQQKRVEHDLRRANEGLEQFAFSASHDLQEPLRTIRIYSELLGRRHADKLDGRALEYMNHLRNAAGRMEALVRDLLRYAEAPNSEEEAQTADANQALQKALANLSTGVAESRAQILAHPLPSIAMRETHLQQLFQNLVGNAIKYRSPDRTPRVQIAAEQRNGSWVFSVADNGIGIDPQYKEHIFGLFKRLHANDEYAGTGIGLAICRRILDQYGGRIWVESAPGQGSIFRFRVSA